MTEYNWYCYLHMISLLPVGNTDLFIQKIGLPILPISYTLHILTPWLKFKFKVFAIFLIHWTGLPTHSGSNFMLPTCYLVFRILCLSNYIIFVFYSKYFFTKSFYCTVGILIPLFLLPLVVMGRHLMLTLTNQEHLHFYQQEVHKTRFG